MTQAPWPVPVGHTQGRGTRLKHSSPDKAQRTCMHMGCTPVRDRLRFQECSRSTPNMGPLLPT